MTHILLLVSWSWSSIIAVTSEDILDLVVVDEVFVGFIASAIE